MSQIKDVENNIKPKGDISVNDIGWHSSGKNGAVVAGGADAVAAGIGILEQGGNAADAAVATLLALAVTDYGAFCIGGEVPFMIFDAERNEVKVLSGLGSAPLDPSAIEWFYKNGIPANGDVKAAPVPGAVSCCFKALEVYGTVSFETVCEPALALLDSGKEVWHPLLAQTFRKMIESEQETGGTREEKLDTARSRFYRGDIADHLEAWYVEQGGFLRKADLAAHQTLIEDPVTVSYRDHTVCKCGPWTQGPFLLQTLRLVEGWEPGSFGHCSRNHIHLFTEAMKLAFADRDLYYGDPLFTQVPLEKLLSDKYTELRRPLIDMEKASDEVRPGDPSSMEPLAEGGVYRPGIGGTTTCCVADKHGNVVAATPSGNPPYIEPVGGKTGIAHGNRLRCLNTNPDHPNRLEPGKRPCITLTPTLVLKEGKPVIAVSVAGGDEQDQTTLNVLLNHIDFGMMPADAVTAPRFSTGHHENSFSPAPVRRDAFVDFGSLKVQAGVPENVRDGLEKAGHRVSVTDGPIAYPVMILIDQDTGIMYAAGDPAAWRHAAAI